MVLRPDLQPRPGARSAARTPRTARPTLPTYTPRAVAPPPEVRLGGCASGISRQLRNPRMRSEPNRSPFSLGRIPTAARGRLRQAGGAGLARPLRLRPADLLPPGKTV